jgi:uncharacterized protein (TIGR00375 family)
MAAWATAKGIDVLATADFTHPKWLREMSDKLEPAESGLFRLKAKFQAEDGNQSYSPAPMPSQPRETRFMLSTEISCIYKKGGRARRQHLVILMPSIAAVRRLVGAFEKRKFNLASDGRPILGLDAKEAVKMALDADSESLVIPAHAWTPWFSVFGSESGFDLLDECFDEMVPHIHAIETGLSSDPPMNWRLSKLDSVMLVSNSDAHSLNNLGREANAMDLDDLSYSAIVDVLRRRDRERFLFTVEFFPEEGKYHVDGHRACGYSCLPETTEKLKGLCPKCGKEVTRGVLGRVHELADRPDGSEPEGRVGFRRVVPLEEIIAASMGKGRASKSVTALYAKLVAGLGPEFEILLDLPTERIAAVAGGRLAEAVARMRAGKLALVPGYDGVYGQVKIFGDEGRSAQGRLLI